VGVAGTTLNKMKRKRITTVFLRILKTFFPKVGKNIRERIYSFNYRKMEQKQIFTLHGEDMNGNYRIRSTSTIHDVSQSFATTEKKCKKS